MANPAERPDAASEQNNAKPMNGRVDAIDMGQDLRLGLRPDGAGQRLTIRVLLDGKMIAEAVADRNRPDLRRNGIGDGKHAFEIALPEPVLASDRSRRRGAKRSRSEQALRVPQPDEQAAEALIAAPLTKVLDKLDVLMAAQRQLQISQRSVSARIRSTTPARPRRSASSISAHAVESLRIEISQRLNDLDVHLMRLDGVVAGMEKTLNGLQKRSNGELKPLLLLLFVLVGFAAGAAMTLLART